MLRTTVDDKRGYNVICLLRIRITVRSGPLHFWPITALGDVAHDYVMYGA